MIEIQLSRFEIELATKLAVESLAVFSGRPGFYTNSLNSHFKGKLGEICFSRYLETTGVSHEKLFMEIANLSSEDIKLSSGLRIDVKTWSNSHWRELGRCVSVYQLDALKKKADAIVWCIAPDIIDVNQKFYVRGWSKLDDVAQSEIRWTGPQHGRKVKNHQLDEAQIRNLETLFL